MTADNPVTEPAPIGVWPTFEQEWDKRKKVYNGRWRYAVLSYDPQFRAKRPLKRKRGDFHPYYDRFFKSRDAAERDFKARCRKNGWQVLESP